jgi:hypothetical protein
MSAGFRDFPGSAPEAQDAHRIEQEQAMHAKEARNPGKFVVIVGMALIFAIAGCGGGTPIATHPTPPPPPPPTPTEQSMQGAWILLFHSDVSDGNTALEANLSQAGNHVFADKTSALIFQASCNCTLLTQLERLGGKCDSDGVDDVTVDATLSNQGPALVSLTLSETGALGSAVTTASASTNGAGISDGKYSTPAACGFPEDHGTFIGYRDSIAFARESYSGTFNGGAHVIVAEFASTANTYDLTTSGTDNGTSFVLSGSTVGTSMNLTGTIAGRATSWFGLYDSTYNSFYIYDSDSKLLGSLQPSANP